ncbi:MAG: hypothetical protein K2M66_03185, partial [Alistipes sp.]|nr:hypothetical protein [Alistipes sp.]
ELGPFDTKEEFELMLVSFLGTGNLQSLLWAVQGLEHGLSDLPAFLLALRKVSWFPTVGSAITEYKKGDSATDGWKHRNGLSRLKPLS